MHLESNQLNNSFCNKKFFNVSIAVFIIALIGHRVLIGALNYLTLGYTGYTPILLYAATLAMVIAMVINSSSLKLSFKNIIPAILLMYLVIVITLHQLTSALGEGQVVVQTISYIVIPLSLILFSYKINSECIFTEIIKYSRIVILIAAAITVYALFEYIEHFGAMGANQQIFRDRFSIVHTLEQLASEESSTNAILEGRLFGFLAILSLVAFYNYSIMKWILFFLFLFIIEVIGNRQSFYGVFLVMPLLLLLNARPSRYLTLLFTYYNLIFLLVVLVLSFVSFESRLANVQNESRINLIKDALSSLDKVNFFGNGPFYFSNNISWHYPHNITIELLFEYGYVAAIFYWALIFSFFGRVAFSFLNRSIDKLDILLISLALYGLFIAHISGTISLNLITLSFLALYFSLSSIKKSIIT